jgi:hypothetical protein
MNMIKLSHLLFSVAWIAALFAAAVPSTPVYAMSESARQPNTSIRAADIASSTLSGGAVLCRSITFWRNGHRVTVWVCHRVHKEKA